MTWYDVTWGHIGHMGHMGHMVISGVGGLTKSAGGRVGGLSEVRSGHRRPYGVIWHSSGWDALGDMTI